MKMKTIVCMLLMTIATAMGCARNEVVKDDAMVSAANQKDSASTVPSVVPATAAESKQPATTGSSAASKSGNTAQQGIPTIVYFGFDSYALNKDSQNALKAISKTLESKPAIEIEGHCDERGSSEYNLALGEKRSKSARNYLVSLGYPAAKISTVSFGKERPVDKNSNEAAWAKNRRDEFKIK